MKISPHRIDAFRLASRAIPDGRLNAQQGFRLIRTKSGPLRLRDTGPRRDGGATVLIAPDGPNVIEHYDALSRLLEERLRIVVIDMPGFGFSYPSTNYRFTLDDGADAVLEVMNALEIKTATLSFPCANGYYAAAAAKTAPDRIRALVLVQTPSLEAMREWTSRSIPRIVRFPGIGQFLMSFNERKAPREWYKVATPNRDVASTLQEVASAAFDHGGCFCLAGIVQGLSRENAQRLVDLKTPTTIVWGNRDKSHRFTSPDSALGLFEKAKIEVFEGCGHFADLEQPDRFADILIRSSGA